MATFSSGCLHADWILIENAPAGGEAPTIDVIVKRSEIEILDSWNAVGLAGTAATTSNSTRFSCPVTAPWLPAKIPPAA
jgi:hypothetical protein